MMLTRKSSQALEKWSNQNKTDGNLIAWRFIQFQKSSLRLSTVRAQILWPVDRFLAGVMQVNHFLVQLEIVPTLGTNSLFVGK